MIKVICSIDSFNYTGSAIEIYVKASCLSQPISTVLLVIINDLYLSEDSIKSQIRSSVASSLVSLATANGYSTTISEAEVRIL